MNPGNEEHLLQSKKGDIDSRNLTQTNLIQLKPSEILIISLKIFTSNFKFMILMILSILPLFIFMVFSEIKLQKSILYALSNPLLGSSYVTHVRTYISVSNPTQGFIHDYDYTDDHRNEFLSNILQIFIFYFFIYPFLEFFSMNFTIKTASKIHSADNQLTVKDILHQKITLKGPFITYLCVHLLSFLNLIGLLWVTQIHNYIIFSSFSYFNFVRDIGLMDVLIFGVHLVMFLGLLYKYIGWSAFWNLSMAISIMEEQSGIAAFGMWGYYDKHCKKTGFGLMLGVFMFGNVLRLPCFFAGLCNGGRFGSVLITCIVMMFFSLGNLVKWIAFFVYFYHCKQQTMEKKFDHDQELGVKLVSNAALS
ncbi:unnamed protein product [Amaranthus hypochondriacus]